MSPLPVSLFVNDTDSQTAKMVRKAAAEQREKLAALKRWTHYDTFNKTSFANVADTILYNLLWDDYEKFPSQSALKTGKEDDVALESEASDAEMLTAARPSKRSKTDKKARAIKADDPLDGVFSSDVEEGSQASFVMGSDEEDVQVSSAQKRKREPEIEKSGTSTRGRVDLSPDEPSKRHNLLTLAEKGQAGRITYVFERISSSKM